MFTGIKIWEFVHNLLVCGRLIKAMVPAKLYCLQLNEFEKFTGWLYASYDNQYVLHMTQSGNSDLHVVVLKFC